MTITDEKATSVGDEDSGPRDKKMEIDLSKPAPLSKKEERKAKRHKMSGTKGETVNINSNEENETNGTKRKALKYSIWIGNLDYSVTETELKDFLSSRGQFDPECITRIKMPFSIIDKTRSRSKIMSDNVRNIRNKGFAYVDFASQSELIAALGLSERFLRDRPVLIKRAEDFTGRPEAPAKDADAADGGSEEAKPVKKRQIVHSRVLYLGNLPFDVTDSELSSHFETAGDIQRVRLMTFEDNPSKCKGFGFIDFRQTEGAQSVIDEKEKFCLLPRGCRIKIEEGQVRRNKLKTQHESEQRTSGQFARSNRNRHRE